MNFYHVWWLLKKRCFCGSFLFTANFQRNNSSWTLLELFPLDGKLSCGRVRLGRQATYQETTSGGQERRLDNRLLLQSDISSEKNQGLLLSALLWWQGIGSCEGQTANREKSLVLYHVAWWWFRYRPGMLLDPSRIEERVSLCIHRREADWQTCSQRRQWFLPANVQLVPKYFHSASSSPIG